MDTQGYDHEVFEGATGVLSSVFGLQSELSVIPFYLGTLSYLDSLELYRKAGFEMANFSAVTRSENCSTVELNCVMRRHPVRTELE